MAEGRIASYDEEKENGYIQPDSGGDQIPFVLEDVVDHHEGETIEEGDRVTYKVEGFLAGDEAKDIRRVAKRGYG